MLSFIVAFAVSLLAGIGVGGGGLYILYLTAVQHMEQLTAQGINLAFFMAGAVAASVMHMKKRNIAHPVLGAAAFFGIPGAIAGVMIAGVTKPVLLSKLFGGLLLFMGIRALFSQTNRGFSTGRK